MSIPNERMTTTGEPATTAAKITADGRRVFRMTAPQVMWWSWVALIVISLGDLAIQGHEFVSLKVGLAGLAITGIVYACTYWPVVVADQRGIKVRNPLRSFDIPWGAVRGIFLADSVEVQCARPASKKDKTVYAWALASSRRSRARSQLRGWQWDQGQRGRPSGYGQLPHDAKSLTKMTTAEIMARELAALSDEARFKYVVQDVELDADAIRREEAEAEARDSAPDPSPPDPSPAQTSTADPSTADPSPAEASPAEASPAETSAGEDPALPVEVIKSAWAWQPLAVIVVPAVAFVICLIVQ